MTLYDAIVGLKRSSEAKLEYALQFWPEAGEDRKRSGFCVDNLSGVSVGKPDPPQPKPRHQEASRAPGAEIGTNAPLRGKAHFYSNGVGNLGGLRPPKLE